MKRRNADCGKIRRPIKRNKIAEQIGSNTLLYVKFLMLWAFVITADFLLEFRFEFLWPFWLLLRSVYDSFKYKGLAFSVLFVCIAITSDLVCLFFIPVQWLFFAASTYVWVQYVWHTDKGICLPTIILWILFVYLEAAIRWKDSRNIPHLDLCRPFAAHCIGYPVVTLGFGFKSYVGYRIRQRKQREVAKDNDFYMQLLQEALPKDETAGAATSEPSSGMADHHHGQDHQLTPTTAKDVVVSVAVTTTTLTTTTSAVIQQSNTNGHGHNHHHHNNNHHHNSSKNAQSHVNGHAGGSGSTAVAATSTSNNGSSSSTMNGGVNHSKHLHRKSLDKDSSSGGATSPSGKANNSYSYHQQQHQQTSNSAKEGSRSSADSSHSNGVGAMSPKEKKDCDQFDSVSAAVSSNHNNGHDKKQNHQQNGHVVNYEPAAAEHLQQQVENDPPAVEPKASSNRSGRKNRVKQKADNSNQQQQQLVRLAATLALASSITTLTTTTAATTTTASAAAAMASKDNHHVSDAAAAASSNNTQNGSNQQQQQQPQQKQEPSPPPIVQTVVQTVKVCETCARMEADARKLRTELGQLRQNENELRQKYDSNTANLKSCLQAKQKEHDELQTRFQELTAQRQQERQSLQTVERRLGEERRHRQSLESQLQNERKHRKQAEEKAARASADCGEQCKLKRQQMDHDLRELRRELMSSEESRNNAEKQNRNFEQEMRKFEVQLRNRESQQSSEVLMSALSAMQDKNATLEKNLSAETRVKLDLFSALGETRRQLEIATCSLRTKDKEILDLKAKIVQLLAVMPAMPNDSLCLTGPGPSSSGSGNVGGLRLSDAPQLLSVSALNGGGSGGGGGQPSPMSQHMVLNSPPLINQLGALGVLTSTITTSTAPAMVLPSMQQQQQQHHQQQQQQAGLMTAANGQIVQMQNSANCPSNLDPNASVYTPKNCSQQQQPQQVGGTEA